MAESTTDVEHALKDLQDGMKLLQDDVLPLVNTLVSFFTLIMVLVVLVKVF